MGCSWGCFANSVINNWIIKSFMVFHKTLWNASSFLHANQTKPNRWAWKLLTSEHSPSPHNTHILKVIDPVFNTLICANSVVNNWIIKPFMVFHKTFWNASSFLHANQTKPNKYAWKLLTSEHSPSPHNTNIL